MPAALATLFCSEEDLRYVLSEVGVDLRVIDNAGFEAASAVEAGYITRALTQGTTKVKRYCNQYDPADLATTWSVNEWASIIAARWLCSRRGNPVPSSLEKMYDETMEELELVKGGTLLIEDIGYRSPAWPTLTNVRVDQRYRLRKVRVESPLSDPTPAQHPQNVDHQAEFIFEY